MKIKITPRTRREFEFYRDSRLDMIGNMIGVADHRDDPAGEDALTCWVARDTHGKVLPCREIAVLQKVERSKQSVNLQIKLWAEDVADSALLPQEELVCYTHGWPAWVLSAVMEQAGRILTRTVGFVPRFARLETLNGQWWPPHMDCFCPDI